jgi:cyanate lyase
LGMPLITLYPEADRVNIVMSGKFLPDKTY